MQGQKAAISRYTAYIQCNHISELPSYNYSLVPYGVDRDTVD